jgi:L-alanine-DL-glutamate epimerase-like enolase superfamily enzyme
MTKISKISLYSVEIPFGDTAYKTGKAKTVDSICGTIICIETNTGREGWGEMVPWGRSYLPEYPEGVTSGLSVLCPKLIGQDPRNLNKINQLMDAELCGHGYVKSAIDMACWDILGKEADLPLVSLLGGKISDWSPLNCAVYNGTAEDMISRIDTYRSRGIRIFSTKPSGDIDADLALYEAIAKQREPGETYIADANKSWSVPSALRVARELQKYGFFNLEQPCESYEECLLVRRGTTITTAIDESLVDFDSLVRSHRDNVADIMHIKLSRVGGITKALRMRDYCEVAGLSLSWATSGGTEISDAAATHLACSTASKNLFGLWSCREFNTERFCEGGPVVRNGAATTTNLPGLGVTPDLSKVGSSPIVFS